MSLILDIAATHISARLRQTVVGVLAVATGVGFSIMMAALMEGSQKDFIRQLVDALPHVSLVDERREPAVQPASLRYNAVAFHSLGQDRERRGIKNPLATLASMEDWLPGAAAPSVRTQAIVSYAGRERAVNLLGIDPRREPRVSKLHEQIRNGSLNDLYRASNAIILGSGLAGTIGARIGNTVTITTAGGRSLSATVVALSHAGIKQADDSNGTVLVRTAQVLAGQTGLINEIRVKLDDVMQARAMATRIESQTGYKAVSWEEANEDLLSAFVIRNIIMYTVVGAILLVASFGTFNIVSTITHEKARDIAIMRSLGLSQATVRSIFVLEAAMIGVAGMLVGFVFGALLSFALQQVEFKSPFADATRLPILYSPLHYFIAGAIAVGSSVLAGYLPASKAARVHPVDIIRGAT